MELVLAALCVLKYMPGCMCVYQEVFFYLGAQLVWLYECVWMCVFVCVCVRESL